MLDNIPLFAGLRKQDLTALTQHAVTRSVPPQTLLINEGERSDSLYVIHTGKVKVFAADEDGAEVILGYLGPSDVFGEMSLVDESPRSASVMTVSPTRLSIVSKPAFRQCLATNPDLALSVIQALARRVRVLTENVKNLALLDVYGRVARTLLNLGTAVGNRVVIDPRPTQQEIANMVGASREMVNRILKDLASGGYIDVQRTRIVVNERLPRAY